MEALEMEERKCEAKDCPVTFRITKNTPQDYCSLECRIRDKNPSGREKIHMRSWSKVNPDKIRVSEDKKRCGLTEFGATTLKILR